MEATAEAVGFLVFVELFEIYERGDGRDGTAGNAAEVPLDAPSPPPIESPAPQSKD